MGSETRDNLSVSLATHSVDVALNFLASAGELFSRHGDLLLETADSCGPVFVLSEELLDRYLKFVEGAIDIQGESVELTADVSLENLVP
jgi:hypothetical protein